MNRPAVEDRYLTVLEVAGVARCEHKTVRRAIWSGELRAFRPAGRLLIREGDARAWIEGREVEPAPRVQAVACVAARGGGGRSRAASVAALREIERGATSA